MAGSLPPPPATAVALVGNAPLRRLNRTEYDNAVRDLLGVTSGPARSWVNEPHLSGFDNDVAGQVPNLAQVEQFLGGAEEIARDAVGRLSQLFPCDVKAKGDRACGTEFIDRFGKRAYRRPLTDDDRKRLLAAFDLGHKEDGYTGGIRSAIEYILMSPHFWYRIERGGAPNDKGVAQLTDWELASRISFLTQNTIPDEELLTAAGEGRLRSPEGIAREIQRLVASEKGGIAIRNFHRQWLELDRLEELNKDKAAFGQVWSDAANKSLIEGVYAFVDHLFTKAERADLSELLTARWAFVDAHTAPLYGLSGVTGNELRKMDIAEPRAGLVTNAGFMAALANRTLSNPIARGSWVREKILCQPAPPPPNDVDVEFPEAMGATTVRAILEEHRKNPTCAGCHALIDPIGMAFENYDAVGRYRTTENGMPIDARGEIKGTRAADGAFDGAVALAQHLGRSADVHECLATQWFNYGFGRASEEEDMPYIRALTKDFSEKGDMRRLIVAIATSEEFRFRKAARTEGGCQ